MRTVAIPMEKLAQLLDVQLQHDGHAWLTVTGNSMYPMLRNRRDAVRLCLTDRVPGNRELILYRRKNGQYVLHRIVRIVGPGAYLCAGDNQWELENVSAEQVIAVVDTFRRHGKIYGVSHGGYQLYVRLWTAMVPVRRPILALRRLLGNIKRRIFKRSR